MPLSAKDRVEHQSHLVEFLDFNSTVDVEKKSDPRNAGVDVGKKLTRVTRESE